mmetsp:Transcript_20433/g.37236  ORF Transcript_20433/g.37236 Transcript_20433/m.37236 type:complete len:202 (+) Transcript_20433:122-727(+)
MISVAITMNAKTNLAVLAIILPSPITNPVTVHADMMLFKHTPFPADAPTTCSASTAFAFAPIASAAINCTLPNARFDTVVDPLKKAAEGSDRRRHDDPTALQRVGEDDADDGGGRGLVLAGDHELDEGQRSRQCRRGTLDPGDDGAEDAEEAVGGFLSVNQVGDDRYQDERDEEWRVQELVLPVQIGVCQYVFELKYERRR